MRTDRAFARLNDPFTSHAAAATISRKTLGTVRANVLKILVDAAEPMSHDEIISTWRGRELNGLVPFATDSSIRSRVKELHRDGLVALVPDRTRENAHGRKCLLWFAQAVPENGTKIANVGDRGEEK